MVTLQDDDSFDSFRSKDQAVGVWDNSTTTTSPRSSA
jgi:hypothetical protein